MSHPIKNYYPNGSLLSITYYKKDGFTKHFPANHSPAETFYYETGKPMAERWYKDGVIHREEDKPAEIYYFPNGMVESEVWYRNGIKNRWDSEAAKIYYYNFETDKVDISPDVPLRDIKKFLEKAKRGGIPKTKFWYKKGKLELVETLNVFGDVISRKSYKDGKLHNGRGFATLPERQYFLEGHEITFLPEKEIDIFKVDRCAKRISKKFSTPIDRVYKSLSTVVYDKPFVLDSSAQCTSDTKQSLITMEEYEGKVIAIKKKVKNKDIVVCFSCEDLDFMSKNRQATTYPHLPLSKEDYLKLYNFQENRCTVDGEIQ